MDLEKGNSSVKAMYSWLDFGWGKPMIDVRVGSVMYPVKAFLWLLRKGKIQPKDVLSNRGVAG